MWKQIKRIRSLVVVVALLGSIGAPAANAALAQGAAGAVTVTSQQTAYGNALFTADGFALYMLSYDTVGTRTTPAQSSCTGKCAGAWPPLLAPGPGAVRAAGGVTAAGLGTIQRADGSYQVTYYGWPLYGFVGDKSAGQTNGENVAAFNGLWHLLTLAGQPEAGTATVMLESSPEGQVLATPTAFSTYRSLYDLTTDPPNASTCFDGCARFWWPLLTAGQPIAGSGVDAGALGTIKRPDGTLQVTYFGVPVYLFAFDLGAGATSGLINGEDNVDQFANGIWYLMSPNGSSAPAPVTVGSTSSPFGTILNWNKNPLYAFSGDSAASSVCTALCARTWTPLITTGSPQAAAKSGVDQTALGTIQRPDGTMQVTYHGQPLYTFALDFAGTDGQGITTFGGTLRLMQTSGVPSPVTPTERSVVAVPELTRYANGLSASFVVAFTSASPGQSVVLFGSGPGCLGLVETATNDTGAGTSNHSVIVTGNDLPGTIGDNGIQPGATYSFEVVTVSGSGHQIDDNGGKCYSVSIPSSS
jgi:predicted lipoprotein with Yx(FWY)xxD motif